MRTAKAWTNSEIQIMKDSYLTKGPTILAKELNRSYFSVQRKAANMGIYLRASGTLSLAQLQQLDQLHALTRQRGAVNKPIHLKEQQNRSRLTQIEIRRKNRNAHTCIRCKQPSINHSTQYCLLHWATLIGHTCKHYDIAFGHMLLSKLETQHYRCAVTGDSLVPGINTSIDHIVPKCKGGSVDSPDNLQWVTGDVNFAKRQMLSDEFVAFCRRVIAYHDSPNKP
jgi:hypothetical protein